MGSYAQVETDCCILRSKGEQIAYNLYHENSGLWGLVERAGNSNVEIVHSLREVQGEMPLSKDGKPPCLKKLVEALLVGGEIRGGKAVQLRYAVAALAYFDRNRLLRQIPVDLVSMEEEEYLANNGNGKGSLCYILSQEKGQKRRVVDSVQLMTYIFLHKDEMTHPGNSNGNSMSYITQALIMGRVIEEKNSSRLMRSANAADYALGREDAIKPEIERIIVEYCEFFEDSLRTFRQAETPVPDDVLLLLFDEFDKPLLTYRADPTKELKDKEYIKKILEFAMHFYDLRGVLPEQRNI